MPIHNLYLRQGNITFSRDFLNILRRYGFIITRRNRFLRNGLVINHGNHNPISLGRRVNRFYVCNNPDYIHYCSNKLHNYNILSSFYPKTWTNIENISQLPIVAKPLNGHHGYGIAILHTPKEIREFHSRHPIGYIYQEKIDIRHEYRFNIFNREIYQISHRERREERTSGGGYQFYYRSLGNSADISDKFYDYVYCVIDAFHSKVGDNIGHYTIDVMKGMDNKYYLTEMNSACGLGDFTTSKLVDAINKCINTGDIEKYRVR